MTDFNVNQENLEKLSGIVERVTYHNPENGWTVLKVSSFRDQGKLITVLIHQAQVFAGATMDFWGTYSHHSQYGEQFKAVKALEKKPATVAALEKYLGSGLIKGVGPVMAKKIIVHFGDRTMDVFENRINDLLKVPGIANKKIIMIKNSWQEHRAIREVMIFLQEYGISTLFATKIYKTYGDSAIKVVSNNPYQLAHDIYGIGFFSADKVALSMGFESMGIPRMEAGIKHVLAASRDEGHCFLTSKQISKRLNDLLRLEVPDALFDEVLNSLLKSNQIKLRKLLIPNKGMQEGIQEEIQEGIHDCFYSKGLYFDEQTVANKIKTLLKNNISIDATRINKWANQYCQLNKITLSPEQIQAVTQIPSQAFSLLTGGPGCGKTTCTRVLVKLLKAMNKRVTLAAPTGRAAQRMSEVIGMEAKTIHRLLEWNPLLRGFKRNEEDQLPTDFLIVDETSMLDISLASHLLKAVPPSAQVLFIGDPDQLPAVGAGDVLSDLLSTEIIPRYQLTQVFRQAQKSSIIQFAHGINQGQLPRIPSPLVEIIDIGIGKDCFFLDSDEATQEQLKFLHRARHTLNQVMKGENYLLKVAEKWQGRLYKTEGPTQEVAMDPLYFPEEISEQNLKEPFLNIPDVYKRMDWNHLLKARNPAEELMSLMSRVHPWSSLHYGMTAVDSVLRLYTKSIPEWLGSEAEIQVLSPQVRGSLGTLNLNQCLQQVANPPSTSKRQIQLGGKIFREKDRVIQTRNNYDLGVFNGDIGHITLINTETAMCRVQLSGGDQKIVEYSREDLNELSLAYAITIHKSQGSEFQVVIIPLLGQHFNMLYRNLIYTGLTRAKKLALFVGNRKALALAIKRTDRLPRQTALCELLNH